MVESTSTEHALSLQQQLDSVTAALETERARVEVEATMRANTEARLSQLQSELEWHRARGASEPPSSAKAPDTRSTVRSDEPTPLRARAPSTRPSFKLENLSELSGERERLLKALSHLQSSVDPVLTAFEKDFCTLETPRSQVDSVPSSALSSARTDLADGTATAPPDVSADYVSSDGSSCIALAPASLAMPPLPKVPPVVPPLPAVGLLSRTAPPLSSPEVAISSREVSKTFEVHSTPRSSVLHSTPSSRGVPVGRDSAFSSAGPASGPFSGLKQDPRKEVIDFMAVRQQWAERARRRSEASAEAEANAQADGVGAHDGVHDEARGAAAAASAVPATSSGRLFTSPLPPHPAARVVPPPPNAVTVREVVGPDEIGHQEMGHEASVAPRAQDGVASAEVEAAEMEEQTDEEADEEEDQAVEAKEAVEAVEEAVEAAEAAEANPETMEPRVERKPSWLEHPAVEPLLRTAREKGDGLKELGAMSSLTLLKVKDDVTKVKEDISTNVTKVKEDISTNVTKVKEDISTNVTKVKEDMTSNVTRLGDAMRLKSDAMGEGVAKVGENFGNRLLRVLACTPREPGAAAPAEPVERFYLFHNGQARDTPKDVKRVEGKRSDSSQPRKHREHSHRERSHREHSHRRDLKAEGGSARSLGQREHRRDARGEGSSSARGSSSHGRKLGDEIGDKLGEGSAKLEGLLKGAREMAEAVKRDLEARGQPPSAPRL